VGGARYTCGSFLWENTKKGKKFAKTRGRCEDDIRMVVKKWKGWRWVRAGNFDLGKDAGKQ